MSVFRGCMEILDMVKGSHGPAVKSFAEETLEAWFPFFADVIKAPLSPAPREEEEMKDGGAEEEWRGLIALKTQAVKTLMKIRNVFPALLSPQSPLFFTSSWRELAALQAAYHQLYINDERQGRLVDADSLPYTLDLLVVEELDFMQACLRAPLVRKQLEAELQPGSPGWLTEMVKLAAAYGQITTEEEGLWEIDVNVFLSEETSVTANYTPRIACGDLLIKLGEWMRTLAADTAVTYTGAVFSNPQRYVSCRDSGLSPGR